MTRSDIPMPRPQPIRRCEPVHRRPRRGDWNDRRTRAKYSRKRETHPDWTHMTCLEEKRLHDQFTTRCHKLEHPLSDYSTVPPKGKGNYCHEMPQSSASTAPPFPQGPPTEGPNAPQCHWRGAPAPLDRGEVKRLSPDSAKEGHTLRLALANRLRDRAPRTSPSRHSFSWLPSQQREAKTTGSSIAWLALAVKV